MMRNIARILRDIDSANSYQPNWYAVFFKPTYIIRSYLASNIFRFSNKYCVPHMKILDVGCGEKPYRNMFQNCDYSGIDIHGGPLDDELKKVDAYFDGISIPFKDYQFDVVLLIEVLEHAEYPERLLLEIKRVLKKDGILFMTMPFAWREHGAPYDFRRLTSYGHRKILEEAGFIVSSIENSTGIFGTCGQMISEYFYELFSSIIPRGFGYSYKFFIRKLFVFLVCSPIQIIALGSDYVFGRSGITSTYAVVAVKHDV